MRLKIFKNFFVTTACIFFVSLTLLFVIMSFVVNGYLSDNRRELLEKSVDLIGNQMQRFEDERSNLAQNTNTVAAINGIEIFALNADGRVILCSCDVYSKSGECEHSSVNVPPDELHGITEEGVFKVSTLGGRYENMSYISAKRISVDNAELYLYATASTVSVTEILGLMFRIYAVSALLPLILMFIAEYILIYRLVKPLKYMSTAAKSIAKGDFSKRVPVMSEDEIGELSVLFNRMTDALSKNETVRRNFISNVSHELKTPMTTIGGFIDGIIDGTVEESKRDYYLKIVSEEVKRLSRLVTSMLSVARLESDERVLKPSDFDLAELMLSVVVSMEQRITEKGLEIQGLEDLSHTLVNADKDLIYQVVYNLVDNAVKYSETLGWIKFAAHRIGNSLVFSVSNNGVGIPNEDRPHIFERFYKTDKSRSGNKDSLGLGLYITKTIIDLHDGDITVFSKEGEYTEFKVTLPINL